MLLRATALGAARRRFASTTTTSSQSRGSTNHALLALATTGAAGAAALFSLHGGAAHAEAQVVDTPKQRDAFRATWEATVRGMQNDMCAMLEAVDGEGKFREDVWTRPEGGGGLTRVMEGKVFEKAGVNVSTVHGTLPKAAALQMKSRGLDLGDKPSPFFACGMSLVTHPRNPFAPTMHANYRYFEVVNPDTGKVTWWFGGGADLTPSYLFEDDAVLFHSAHKQALDKRGPALYQAYKAWCDEYFYLPHRKETRGVGGIFFDDVDELPDAPAATTSESARKEAIRRMDVDLVAALRGAYETIINRRKETPFTAEQKRWQQLRRGRYVEFNIGIDRGTRFGMQTPGSRIESIFMSLPLTARYALARSRGTVLTLVGALVGGSTTSRWMRTRPRASCKPCCCSLESGCAATRQTSKSSRTRGLWNCWHVFLLFLRGAQPWLQPSPKTNAFESAGRGGEARRGQEEGWLVPFCRNEMRRRVHCRTGAAAKVYKYNLITRRCVRGAVHLGT